MQYPGALVVVDQVRNIGSLALSRARLASYCGLAPRNRRSGTSISSVCASRQGNKRLKNLLIFSCNCLSGKSSFSRQCFCPCRICRLCIIYI